MDIDDARTGENKRLRTVHASEGNRAPEQFFARSRHDEVLRVAAEQGLLGSRKDGRITGRVSRKLIDAAKAKTRFASDTDLVTYALAKVALEDDFGELLLSMKGSVPATVDLEF